MSRAEELLRGREALIAQCETQRVELAMHIGGLGTPIRIADRIAKLMRYLRSHPVALGASVAALMVAQRRGLLKWGQRALVVWRVWNTLRSRRGSF